MELAPGLKHSQTVTVTEDMTPGHLRGDAIRVLATPEMVRLVEQTAIQAVQPHLKPGQSSVGTTVSIKHIAGTPEGMKVTISVELAEMDRRRPIADKARLIRLPVYVHERLLRTLRARDALIGSKGQATLDDLVEATGFQPSVVLELLQLASGTASWTTPWAMGS